MSETSSTERAQLGATVRPAGLDYWAAIRNLHAFSFRSLTGPTIEQSQCEAFVARIFEPDYTDALLTHDLQVAWYDGRPIGTAGWVPSDDRGTVARITSVYVSPLFTRLGIGRQLVTTAEARARAAGFRTYAARAFQPAAPFFEAVGYSRSSQGIQAIGTENGIPVVFMRKTETIARRDDCPGRPADTLSP